jgi:hypothetical protein
MHTHEQHLGHVLGDRALHLPERAQALARGELLAQALEGAFQMAARGQIDVEISESGCDCSDPPASPHDLIH